MKYELFALSVEKLEEIHHFGRNIRMSANRAWPSTQMTLIERIASPADAEAWEYFHKVYSPLILQFCQRYFLQPTDADDVCQNVIQSMRKSLAQYEKSKGRFRYWFSSVIQRQIAKHLKKEGQLPRATGGNVDIVADVAARLDDDAAADEVRKYILKIALNAIRSEFTAKEWVVMEEVILKGRKPRELALEMDWDAPSISKAKYRLMKRLKEKVHFLDDGDVSHL